jgi:hypothetical protein
MKENANVKSGGVGFTGLLQLVFITLKLLKVIDWPWVWVLAPVWISSGLGILIIAMYFLVLFLRNKK